MSPVSPFPTQPREGPPPPTAEVPKQTLLDYLDATGLSLELTEAEITQFVSVCQAFGLSPWKREVYATVYGEGSYRRFSVITGYEVYLKRAERTGRLNGWSSRIDGEGEQMRAIVTIHRKDWAEPLIHEVFFAEAVQKKKDGTPTAFWSKMPRFQLRKVCISQAFRLCFPDELGGLPYDASELPDAESTMPATTFEAPRPSAVTTKEPQTPASAVTVPDPVPEPAPIQLIKLGIPSEASPAAGSIFAGGPRQVHQDPYPDENRDQLLERLEAHLAEHAESFTDRHYEWVMDKAHKAKDREGVLKMLSYSAKVVRNGAAVAGASA